MATRGLKLAEVDFLIPLYRLWPALWILLCALILLCHYTQSNSHFYRKNIIPKLCLWIQKEITEKRSHRVQLIGIVAMCQTSSFVVITPFQWQSELFACHDLPFCAWGMLADLCL